MLVILPVPAVADPSIIVLVPQLMVLSSPADTAGRGFTVTIRFACIPVQEVGSGPVGVNT